MLRRRMLHSRGGKGLGKSPGSAMTDSGVETDLFTNVVIGSIPCMSVITHTRYCTADPVIADYCNSTSSLQSTPYPEPTLDKHTQI